MFTNPKEPYSDFPVLKSKAAETKCLGPALLAAWATYHDPNDVQHLQINVLLKTSVEMDELLKSSEQPWRLTHLEAQRYIELTTRGSGCRQNGHSRSKV